ncbi:MAG: hypothetical protein LBV39_00610 [Bacteroidales bacterium]|nr:hypothetical protein [Bacteroidales bacterium]
MRTSTSQELRSSSTRYGVVGAVVLLYPALHTGLFTFNTSGVASYLDCVIVILV